jgi:DNA-binding IclR family transcriptional regulator
MIRKQMVPKPPTRQIVYLALVTGSGPLRVHVDVGHRLPAHRTALGKALLADLPDTELEQRLKSLAARGDVVPGSRMAASQQAWPAVCLSRRWLIRRGRHS